VNAYILFPNCPRHLHPKSKSSEFTCPTDTFRCRKSGACLPLSDRCNGRVDCPEDKSDEMGCREWVIITGFSNSSLCVSPSSSAFFVTRLSLWSCVLCSMELYVEGGMGRHVQLLSSLFCSSNKCPIVFTLSWPESPQIMPFMEIFRPMYYVM
jgi:hypothetical protein